VDVDDAVRGLRDAHDALLEGLDRVGLSDAAAGRPSALPGWTVAHVLTHVARNADSHRRMVEAALAGEVVDQYPGGQAQRAAEIDDGAGRSAAALVEDLRASESALAAALARVDGATWAGSWQRRNGGPWPLADLPFLRWREVAVHTVDLGLGLGPAEAWSPAYVDAELRRQAANLALRLPPGFVRLAPTDAGWSTVVAGPGDPASGTWATVAATSVEVLGWLLGRREGELGWPSLRPWTGSP
jgi:maleylpyruvate isomerase